jgi:hypothetical protein
MHLTVCTHVLYLSHRRMTYLLDQEYTPKHHDDSVMGYASPSRGDLPNERFGSAVTPSTVVTNNQARGASHLSERHHRPLQRQDKTSHHRRPCPLF